MSRRRPSMRIVKPRGTCKATGKRRFASQLDADTVIAQAQFRARILHDHKRRETRSYECPRCKGWHVTSQSENSFRGAA